MKATTKQLIIRDVEKNLPEEFKIDPSKPTIYLCGGFYGDWNKRIKAAFGDLANILDPRDWQGQGGENFFVPKDLFAVESSDIIFAYRQYDNPGVGMAHEIGYARALEKVILFTGVYENARSERYWGFARVCADYVENNLSSALFTLGGIIERWYNERGFNLQSESDGSQSDNRDGVEAASVAGGQEGTETESDATAIGSSSGAGGGIPVLEQAG